MGCKFMRDVERFNEWGVKADCAVVEYGRKVNCLRLPDEVGKEAGTRRSNKGSKRATDNDREGAPGKRGSGWGEVDVGALALSSLLSMRTAAMGGRGGGGGGRTCQRRNSSGHWRWWMRRSQTKTGTVAATAGAAMAVAAMGTGATLSSLHSLVMLSKRPPELVRQVAPCGGGTGHHQGGGESWDCAGGGDRASWGANL
jgi:hypothetical protein